VPPSATPNPSDQCSGSIAVWSGAASLTTTVQGPPARPLDVLWRGCSRLLLSGRGPPPLVVEDAEQACGGPGARADAELGVDVLQVPSHRGRRDPEDLGDLSVGLAAGDQGEDLALAGRQGELVPCFLQQQ
jgi:hypothetical protein